jgi:biopolymer transport protein ExbB/TolQ
MTESSPLVERLLQSDILQAEWVLYFLLVLLALAIFVILWKTVYFIRNSRQATATRAAVSQLVGGGDIDEFARELTEMPGIESSIIAHALRYRANGPAAVEQQMAVASGSAQQRMEIGLTFLGTVGSNAPFVGLFGTVLGIIKAFRDLALETESASAAVMAGISEALVATAVGLLVAIPAVVAYNYLRRQVKKTLVSSDALNQQLLFRLRASADEG